MESLQLAQMLADLSSLNATEPAAASALLNANKKIDKAIEKNEKAHVQAQAQGQSQKRPTDMRRTASSTGASTPAQGKFHFLKSPPLSRTNSVANSAPGTPHYGSDLEDDVDRASSLMTLHDIKTKLKQQDNSGLIKAREKINALAARQMAREAEGKKGVESSTKSRYIYPK